MEVGRNEVVRAAGLDQFLDFVKSLLKRERCERKPPHPHRWEIFVLGIREHGVHINLLFSHLRMAHVAGVDVVTDRSGRLFSTATWGTATRVDPTEAVENATSRGNGTAIELFMAGVQGFGVIVTGRFKTRADTPRAIRVPLASGSSRTLKPSAAESLNRENEPPLMIWPQSRSMSPTRTGLRPRPPS
jgi:hypothetical protein